MKTNMNHKIIKTILIIVTIVSLTAPLLTSIKLYLSNSETYISSKDTCMTGYLLVYFRDIDPPIFPQVDQTKKHIACVGDSITYGAGVQGQRYGHSYPAYLQCLVGNDWQVLNYGLIGRTLMDSGDKPYTQEEIYYETLVCKADIYIVMLGTNDAKHFNWNAENYESDLTIFLEKYIQLAGADNVYVMQPTKCFIAEGRQRIRYGIEAENIIEACKIIERVANKLQINVINLYSFSENHPEWLPDGIHPNAEGNQKIANYIYKHLDLG